MPGYLLVWLCVKHHLPFLPGPWTSIQGSLSSFSWEHVGSWGCNFDCNGNMSLQISLVHMCVVGFSYLYVTGNNVHTSEWIYIHIAHTMLCIRTTRIYHASLTQQTGRQISTGGAIWKVPCPALGCGRSHFHLQVLALHHTFYQWSTGRTYVRMRGTLKLYSVDLALWILQCVLELPVSMTQVLFGYKRGHMVCV